MAYDTPLPITVDGAKDEEEAWGCPILMTAENFRDAMAEGSFSDDSAGHPVRNGSMNTRIHIDPPSMTYIPDDVTYVVWYPK